MFVSNNEIMVFGSNTKGIHGAGSALAAREKHGAQLGVGFGRTGEAFAIPTKKYIGFMHGRHQFETMTIEEIKPYVDRFIIYANEHPELKFHIVKIGCGLAGHKEELIGPLFQKAPSNCNLPGDWREKYAGN